MKTKRQTKPDPEGELLQMGWDTESTSGGKYRAQRGPFVTDWHDNWTAVLADVNRQNPAHDTPN